MAAEDHTFGATAAALVAAQDNADLGLSLGLGLGLDPDPDALASALAAAREAGYAARRSAVRRNVRAHRQRLRAKGLRPVQFWLPDMRRADAQSEASRQSWAVAWTLPSQSTLCAPATATAVQRGELRLLSHPFVQHQRILVSHGEPGPALPTVADLDTAQMVVIVQDDAFEGLPTSLVCPLTPAVCAAPLLRVAVAPTPKNGLTKRHQLMLDALTTVPRSQLGACIGRLNNADQKRLNQALLVVSGLAR